MYTFFFLILAICSSEHTVASFKKEVHAKIQIYGQDIVKPLDTKKSKKKISKEEQIKEDILKKNSYYKKTITIRDLFLVELKEKRIVFRNFDNNIVNYVVTSKKMPNIKPGLKYKVKGKMLVFSDILVFEFIEASRLF